ncbi:MAG: Rha family transcriptional regulator [Candidatus Cloacimonetes bacterium]|nr:Rha family transcriptional regulator [Candidatus Cloacimonadota bacterium]
MQDLAYLPQNLNGEPFTDSLIISENLNRPHHSITRLIRTHLTDLKDFGKVGFEIHSFGKRNQNRKLYLLNEDQTMLLFTFMNNTPKIRKFKKSLIKIFRLLINELNQNKLTRQIGINTRKSLNDTIKEIIPDSNNKRFIYSNFTKLTYKIALNKTIKAIKQERSIPENGNVRDYLKKLEIQQVNRIEKAIQSLLEIGKSYQDIKEILL